MSWLHFRGYHVWSNKSFVVSKADKEKIHLRQGRLARFAIGETFLLLFIVLLSMKRQTPGLGDCCMPVLKDKIS